ncbi:MAG: protein kinase [bacterium]
MPDLRAQLQTALGHTHIIERELGGGGMSRVFLAEETRFHRQVVIKVLPPELAAELNTARFEREISVAATLQQAQIVPVITAGDVDGLPWYSMPFVEGESLRARLAKGPLPVSIAIAILRDVARALAYAHDHGVVHRDIKPDNILLSGESAVVTDFGIAKAVSAAKKDGDERITLTGSSVGTPAYMPPEQALGSPDIDHRADIYAFGCLAYELFTGKPPFAGANAQQVIASHFHTRPDALRAPPPHIAALVARCLEKDPANRPQNARDVLTALDQASAPRTQTAMLIVAAVIVVAASAAVLLARRGNDNASTANAGPRSLAVLPFVNVNGDSAQEYLADGIRDELATLLGKVNGIRIIGRSAAFQFRGRRDLDVRQVGHTLGARYLVQGTLRQANGRLRVSAQLTDSAGGAELWADTFDGTPADLANVTDRIVSSIGSALHTSNASVTTRTTNPDAYDLYLRGEFLLQRRGRGVGQSVQNFEKAIAIDSTFARAWAGLSAAYVLFPYFDGTPPDVVFNKVESSARRALSLDSNLAEPHVSLALAYWHAARANDAEPEFKRAIAIDANDLNAHLQYGRFLFSLARPREALVELTTAKRIDPLSAIASAWRAASLRDISSMTEARAEMARAWQLDSTILPVINFASALMLVEGKTNEAARIASRAPLSALTYAPSMLAAAGDSAAAFAMLRSIDRLPRRVVFTDAAYALVYLTLNDTARAFQRLEKSAAVMPAALAVVYPLTYPPYEKVRGSAHFDALLRKAGVDPANVANPGRTP